MRIYIYIYTYKYSFIKSVHSFFPSLPWLQLSTTPHFLSFRLTDALSTWYLISSQYLFSCCRWRCDTPKTAEREQAAIEREAEEERTGLTPQGGGGRQMEIDGGRDREIKRNMPLGVTEEGVRGMRGLQAWEPHMCKNNSSTSFSISLSLPLSFSPCQPLLVGEEINSRLVCLRLQEFVVVVECVYVCASVSWFFFFFFAVGGRMRIFEVYPTPQGGAQSLHFLLISRPFPIPFLLLLFFLCVTSTLHPRSLVLQSPLCPLPLSISVFSPPMSVLLFPLIQGGL